MGDKVMTRCVKALKAEGASVNWFKRRGAVSIWFPGGGGRELETWRFKLLCARVYEESARSTR